MGREKQSLGRKLSRLVLAVLVGPFVLVIILPLALVAILSHFLNRLAVFRRCFVSPRSSAKFVAVAKTAIVSTFQYIVRNLDNHMANWKVIALVSGDLEAVSGPAPVQTKEALSTVSRASRRTGTSTSSLVIHPWGISIKPFHAPQTWPAIDAVLSLSPSWLLAMRTAST